MRTTADAAQVRDIVNAARRQGSKIGFVPTMGALHAGHLALVERARSECDVVVASIFVNPTQFAAGEDLEHYPRPRERDLELCRDAGVQLVWEPTEDALYPPGFETFVDAGRLALVLEGAHRPGHFRGVATVVLKLLNIVRPDRAYFGRKDYQQLVIVRRMCRDLDVPVKIVDCETIRDPDGLALSSRNVYLSPSERATALALSRELSRVREALWSGERDVVKVRDGFRGRLEAVEGLQLDYATVVDAETLEELDAPREHMVALVAARVGKTRLIDNVVLKLAGDET